MNSDFNDVSAKKESSSRCPPTSNRKQGTHKCPTNAPAQRFLLGEAKALTDLRRVRHINSNTYGPALAQDFLILQQFLLSIRNNALDEAKFSSVKIVEEIHLLQKLIDEKLMAKVLDFFSILRSEMSINREKRILHSIDCGRRKRQAKRLRDVIVFSRHLEIETQGAVTFTSIQTDTSQWTRCQKAVAENLSVSGMER